MTSASLSSNLIAISAKAHTATEAEDIANAVAASYVTYISSPSLPGGQVLGKMLENAPTATGTSRPVHLITFGLLGGLLGLVIGAIIALARGRGDTRLRSRDEIADAIGVPVLASLPVGHPSDTAGWAVLLSAYQPGVVHAWGMRKALHHLGLTDFRGGTAASLAVISLSSDPGAIALGPQLAIYAATLGIPTELVIGPQQDANATASLRAACAVPTALPPESAGELKIVVEDQPCADRQPEAALSIVVIVVDSRAPRTAGDDAHHGQRGRRVGRRGDRRAAGPGRRRRGGRRPRDRRDHRGRPGPGRPHHRPHAAGGPGRAPAAADPADRHRNGDGAMTVPGASGNIPERDWGLSGFDGDQEVPAADFAAGLTRLPYLSAALRRRARVWITTAVIGLLLGAALSVLKPAPYQASTSVLLTHPTGR